MTSQRDIAAIHGTNKDQQQVMPARKPRSPDEKPRKPDPLDGLPQKERFKAVARELGCDEDPAAFEAALRKIATARKHEPKK